jgi:hypothetical protein
MIISFVESQYEHMDGGLANAGEDPVRGNCGTRSSAGKAPLILLGCNDAGHMHSMAATSIYKFSIGCRESRESRENRIIKASPITS